MLSPCRAPSPPQGGDEGAGLAEEPGTRGRAHRPGRGTKGRSLSEGAQSSRGVAPAGGCQGLLQTAARPPRRGTGSPTGRRGSRPLTRSLGVSQAQRPPGAAVSAAQLAHMCDARDGTRGAGIANGALDPGREQAIGVHRVAGDAVPERHLTALLCGDRREGTSHVDPSPQPSPRLRPAAPVTCWACKNPQGGRLGGPEGRGRGAGGEDARPSKQ